jgi:hypothetical protein
LFTFLVLHSFFQQQCIDIFGDEFNGDYLSKAVANTNTIYGARNIRVDRVLFPNGSIDPWHALGLTKFTFHDSRSLYINGTAHCADMYPTSDNDTQSLIDARQDISDFVDLLVHTSP